VVAFLLGVAFLLCPTRVRAQQGEPPPVPSTGSPQAGAKTTQNPAAEIFKANVNLVLVRVVVRDAEGNAVGGLQKEDFQLFDRGKPQEIKEFSIEEAAGAKTTTEAPRLALSVENSGTLPALPLPPDRYVTYLFDDIHIAFADLVRVRDAAIRHLATLNPRDRVALFTTSGRGNVDFTDDRARLENALRQLQPRPITDSGEPVGECLSISPYQADLMQSAGECSGASRPPGTSSGDAAAIAIGDVMSCFLVNAKTARRTACAEANHVLAANQQESQVSFFVLKDVVRRMSTLSGQRSILLLSPGFYTEPIRYRYEELVDQALRAQVIISALNGRGLYTVERDIRLPGGGDATGARLRLMQAAATADEGVLGLLAYGTGGSYFHNSNDLDQGFREIAGPPDHVYLLGFSPQKLKLDGKFHELKVKVRSSAKLTIQARKGYFATKQAIGSAEQDRTELAGEARPPVPVAQGGAPRVSGEVQPQPATGIEGTWEGTFHQPPAADQRIVWEITKAESGGLRIMMYNVDQPGPAIPVSSASFEDGVLKYAAEPWGLTYEGKMSADRQSIAGTWKQRQTSGQLVLERATPTTAWAIVSLPQPQFVLCEDGKGRFETTLAGVTVAVSATKRGGFAQHSCAASLAWEGHELPVATEAAQVDIDVLGADLGLDAPVVAFQVKKSRDDREMTYLIYSLSKPPQLLRTITGGDFYRAEDADLSGRNAIWTRDIAAIRGFEGFSPSDFDYAPSLALRVEHNQLVDASAEFPAYFDEQISAVRAELSAQDLSDFRQSAGRLADAASSTVGPTHRLRSTKIKVLEIVWAYLDSGRDEEAWGALADMWPSEDLGRIRTAIMHAQARGLRSQVDSVSPEAPELPSKKQQVRIYGVAQSRVAQRTAMYLPLSAPGLVETAPKAILVLVPSTSGADKPLAEAQWRLELVIDAAGKVRTARVQARSWPTGAGYDKWLLEAARGWKFIPALAGGRPVACRLSLDVSPER
jgi:VWFA-related protein